MDFTQIDIHELLPQREPFVMVSELIHFDMMRTVTGTHITEDNLFVDNGVFSASGMMENIAQTCATRIGYANKYIFKKDVQIGFIGAVKKLRIYDRPKAGEYIETEIDVVEEIFGMTLVNAKIMRGEDILADCEMKIALQKEDDL